MTILGTDHTVIAVADMDAALERWQKLLGMAVSHRSKNDDAGLVQGFFALEDGTFIELVAPTSESSSLYRTLEKRGEGVQVLALRVDDLGDSIHRLQAEGLRLIGVGTSAVFIHPKSASGVMVQLWPKSRPHRWQEDDQEPTVANPSGGSLDV